MRQVQAHEAPRGDLRQVRRGGDALEGAPRTARPHRAGQPLLARVVLQGTAQPHRAPAGHQPARAGGGAVLRVLRCGRSGRRAGQGARGDQGRDPLPRAGRPVSSHRLQGHDGRRGDQGAAEEGGCHRALAGAARAHQDRDIAAEEAEVLQAAEDRGGLPQVRQQAAVDDTGRDPGDSAGAAPAGPAGRRPLRNLRPERPLSPRHQPQQPAEEADGPARARGDRAQREAHVAGGGGCAVRQRAAGTRAARRQQSSAEVASPTR